MQVSGGTAQQFTGRITNATLILHGTYALPEYRRSGPRIYDDEFSKFISPVKQRPAGVLFIFIFVLYLFN